jgi:hypothetical protein
MPNNIVIYNSNLVWWLASLLSHELWLGLHMLRVCPPVLDEYPRVPFKLAVGVNEVSIFPIE